MIVSPLFSSRLSALDSALRAAGIPLEGISLIDAATVPPTVRVDYKTAATPAQRTQGASIVASFDWSQAADTITRTEFSRSGAVSLLNVASNIQAVLFRAVAAVLVDELNIAREWTVSFKTEVAAATSLADLKTRVAGLPTLSDRTLAQAKTAIIDKIATGLVDS